MMLPRPCLMLVSAPMDRTSLETVTRAAVVGGVNAVQLRDKTLAESPLTHTSAALVQALGRVPVLVNGYPGAARDAGASGVHLPEHGEGIDAARRVLGPERLIGRSVHSVEAAVRAARD